MIRLSTTQRPEAWHTIEIPMDGEPAEMRVKYWLLSRDQATEYSLHRLELQKAIESKDDSTTFAMLAHELSPETVAEVDALLRERILDWDLEDGDAPEGTKLALTPETLNAVLDQVRFWRPLFQGLINCSNGLGARKNASNGSGGGATTSKRR